MSNAAALSDAVDDVGELAGLPADASEFLLCLEPVRVRVRVDDIEYWRWKQMRETEKEVSKFQLMDRVVS